MILFRAAQVATIEGSGSMTPCIAAAVTRGWVPPQRARPGPSAHGRDHSLVPVSTMTSPPTPPSDANQAAEASALDENVGGNGLNARDLA